MKTTLDLVDILYTDINGSALKGLVSGGVYKYQRPVNSILEDIVINCLPIVNLDLAQAVANVNIHVPNKVQNIGGNQDNTQPDSARLKALATAAVALLEDVYGPDYNYAVQQQNAIQDQTTLEWYINIRINFYSINVN